MTIFAIGVGNVKESELLSIASGKEYKFHVENYDALHEIKKELGLKACEGEYENDSLHTDSVKNFQ